jgi:hypothetical protein
MEIGLIILAILVGSLFYKLLILERRVDEMERNG